MVCFTQLFYVGVLPKHINLKTNKQPDNQLDELAIEEYQKWKLVPFTNAVSDPRAMVVMRSYTGIAILAVFASQGLLDVADCAVLVFKERDCIIREVTVLGIFRLSDFVVVEYVRNIFSLNPGLFRLIVKRRIFNLFLNGFNLVFVIPFKIVIWLGVYGFEVDFKAAVEFFVLDSCGVLHHVVVRVVFELLHRRFIRVTEIDFESQLLLEAAQAVAWLESDLDLLFLWRILLVLVLKYALVFEIIYNLLRLISFLLLVVILFVLENSVGFLLLLNLLLYLFECILLGLQLLLISLDALDV